MHYFSIPLILFPLVATAISVAKTDAGVIDYLKESGRGSVLDTNILHVEGKDIHITTTSFPGFTADKSLPLAAHAEAVQKRQINVCAGPCSVSCDRQTANPPDTTDCATLMRALMSPQLGSFIVPPQTGRAVGYRSCVVGFANLDIVPMTYCYRGLGIHLGTITNQCFQGIVPNSAGFCIAPQTPGNRWGIQAFRV